MIRDHRFVTITDSNTEDLPLKLSALLFKYLFFDLPKVFGSVKQSEYDLCDEQWSCPVLLVFLNVFPYTHLQLEN